MVKILKIVCKFNVIQYAVTQWGRNDRVCGVSIMEKGACVCVQLKRISIFVRLNKAYGFRLSGQKSQAILAKKSQMSENVDKWRI